MLSVIFEHVALSTHCSSSSSKQEVLLLLEVSLSLVVSQILLVGAERVVCRVVCTRLGS
jgi:uncharacterized membrane protein